MHCPQNHEKSMSARPPVQFPFASGALVCLLLCLHYHHAWCMVGEKHLVKSTSCPGRSISQAHRYQTLGARSVLECVVHCRPDGRCVSVVFDAGDKLCYLGDEISLPTCANMEDTGKQGVAFYEKDVKCNNATEEVTVTGQCVCAEGFRGSPCKPIERDCSDTFSAGNGSVSRVSSIQPLLAPEPFPVLCRKPDERARTYILRRYRTANALDFYRNFSEYQAGFGDVEGDYWLGLEKVYQLTNSRNYELRVSAKTFNGTIIKSYYHNFSISDAHDGYRLRFEPPERVKSADCFVPLYGVKFSAWDRDNDEEDSVNCALMRRAGWWFKGQNCSTCNPTGYFLAGEDHEAFWSGEMEDVVIVSIFMFLVIV